MSDDDLTHFARMMDAADVKPDAVSKHSNIHKALQNFDQLQENANTKRPTNKSTYKRWVHLGGFSMLQILKAPGAMLATTAMVAVGVTVYVANPTLLDPTNRPLVSKPVTLEIAPKTENGVDRLTRLIAEPVIESSTSQEFSSSRVVESREYLVDPNVETNRYAHGSSNSLKITQEEPVSTFSIDVDTASWSMVRGFIRAGYMPATDAVRIEEMINYFPYEYPAPTDGAAFRPTVTVMETPWNPGTQLVHIGIQGKMPAVEHRPPLNLVFLVDTSGSMQSEDKLPLLKSSLRLMLEKLTPEDQVAIVTYAGSAEQVLPLTPVSNRSDILSALDQLESRGSTAGWNGLEEAYAVAETAVQDGTVTRILLATDGDFNVGPSDSEDLERLIAKKRDSGVYLSVLGFGRDYFNDEIMQTLAQNGNGTAAYIDTLSEAQKALGDQLTGTLFPIAEDVKVQVEFNPATVAEYRLIGYETRLLRREDFKNDRVDAGEIGAGHTVTAIYEVTPVGSPAVMTDELRYSDERKPDKTSELGYLKLRYKEVGAERSKLMEVPISTDVTEGTADTRFSVAIAGFGLLLKGEISSEGWGYDQSINLANSNRGDDTYGYRAEAVQLMRLTEKLSQQEN